MNTFKIIYKDKEHLVNEGTTYKEFIEKFLNIDSTKIALCRLDKDYYELFREIYRDGKIELIEFYSPIELFNLFL